LAAASYGSATSSLIPRGKIICLFRKQSIELSTLVYEEDEGC
jgi:hypothetical protein